MTLVLAAGALIGVERNDRELVVLFGRAIERGRAIVVPAGVVAQVWRDPSRQVRLARLLNAEDVVIAPGPRTGARGRRLLAAGDASDVIDASVAVLARQYAAAVVTSDAGDIRRLSPKTRVIEC